MARDSAALDEATDHVIREMTHVQISDDAVARVMARLRTAGGAAGGATSEARGHAAVHVEGGVDHQSARGWFGALLEPRVSWGTATAAAALAAILAGGAMLVMARSGGHEGDGVRSGSIATASSGAALSSGAAPTATSGAGSTGPLATASTATSPAASASTPLAAIAPMNARPTSAATTRTATTGTTNETTRLSRAAVATPHASSHATPIVTPVKRGRGLYAAPDIRGIDQTVRAASVATPDEEPSTAQQAAATRAPAPPSSAPTAVQQDIKLDVTITDQSGATKPITKTLSMIVADREMGSVQSDTRMPFQHGAAPAERWEIESLPLSVTVSPTILSDGHVRVKLVLSYRTASQAKALSNEPLSTASVTKNVTAVLTDGKPLILSESADAATDRKVTVELKATIQK